MNKKLQSGRTMVEVIAVLSILGMMISSSIRLVNSMHDKYRASSLISQIRDLRKGISSRYGALGNYTGLTPNILITERLVPPRMAAQNNKLFHAYGGEVTLSVANTGGTGCSYKIAFSDLPYQNCVEAAVINWETESTAALVSIAINETTFTWTVNQLDETGAFVPNNSATSLPLTAAKASTACSTEEGNTITWEFQ